MIHTPYTTHCTISPPPTYVRKVSAWTGAVRTTAVILVQLRHYPCDRNSNNCSLIVRHGKRCPFSQVTINGLRWPYYNLILFFPRPFWKNVFLQQLYTVSSITEQQEACHTESDLQNQTCDTSAVYLGNILPTNPSFRARLLSLTSTPCRVCIP